MTDNKHPGLIREAIKLTIMVALWLAFYVVTP